MKLIGIGFIIIGFIVLIFIANSLINAPQENISPILEDDGVRVIYGTPTE